MIKIQRFVCNMLQENCYILSDDSNECVIVDCGAYFDEERHSILNYIRDHHLTLLHLLCTHGHVDHNFGIDTIYDAFGIQPEVHEGDRNDMETLNDQAVMFIGFNPKANYPAIGNLLSDGDTISFGHHSIDVLYTPGHSKGSVCFYIKSENLLLSGDTLFKNSIGRTDLHGGSMMQIIQSLRQLAQLPDDTTILPGHGPQTTMGDELRTNPFMDR